MAEDAFEVYEGIRRACECLPVVKLMASALEAARRLEVKCVALPAPAGELRLPPAFERPGPGCVRLQVGWVGHSGQSGGTRA